MYATVNPFSDEKSFFFNIHSKIYCKQKEIVRRQLVAIITMSFEKSDIFFITYTQSIYLYKSYCIMGVILYDTNISTTELTILILSQDLI